MTVPFSIVAMQVCEALAPYLGAPYSGDLDCFICADLGLDKRDYAEFVTAMQRREGTPLLAELIDDSAPLARLSWWKHLFGANETPTLRDVSIRQFCDLVRDLYARKQADEAELERRRHGAPHHH